MDREKMCNNCGYIKEKLKLSDRVISYPNLGGGSSL